MSYATIITSVMEKKINFDRYVRFLMLSTTFRTTNNKFKEKI